MAHRVILHAFSTFLLGGAQARFVELANAFGPAYRHVVVAMDNEFATGDRLAPSVDWQRAEVVNHRSAGLQNRAAYRKLLKTWAPDLLLTYNWGAIEWAVANVPRTVPQWHVEDGFGPDEAQAQLPRRVWMRRALLGAAGIPLIVPSQCLAQHAQTWWVPQRRLCYIPNGVAVAAQMRARPAPPADRPLVIGTVAGLRPEKNLARLIKAFAAVRPHHNVRLVLVGDGKERPALEQLAAALGVAQDVEFTGYLTRPHERLVGFDLFALSSDTEQLPIAMLEAMAEGIPVVSTAVGDVPHIVPAVAAAGLCPANDEAFTACLSAVLSAQAEWPAWAAAGLSAVRSGYSRDAMLARWQRVFDGEGADACRAGVKR